MQLQEHISTPPSQISPTYLSTVLQMLAGFKAWASDVQDYALEQMLEGVEVPGYKVVEGTSRRAFKDLNTALESLQTAGYDEALFYERKPISLSQMEKVVGKKEFGTLLQDQVIKPPGKPTIVPLSDKRQPYRQSSSIGDFASII